MEYLISWVASGIGRFLSVAFLLLGRDAIPSSLMALAGVIQRQYPIWILATASVIGTLSVRSFAASDRVDFDPIKYGSESYAEWRQVTYWGKTSISVRDYEYGSGDSEFLKLVIKNKADRFSADKPRDDIQKHFTTEFRRLFGYLPFHDLEEGRDQRWAQFRRENPRWDTVKDPNVDFMQAYEAFDAAEVARRNALHGGRAGALFCNIRVKRRTFPVLYEIACSLSANDDLRYETWREARDISFSTPEHIDKEINQAITRVLEKQSSEFAKARRYGKK